MVILLLNQQVINILLLQIFVELDELKYVSGRMEWKETARWIKYEEDVEGVGASRWGKPHIAILNFHALFSLRKGLEAGKYDH